MVRIDDLSVRIAGRLLLEHASVQIPTGARVGLVGRNGAGKSTLFRVIAGEMEAETGEVHLPPRWRMARLEQEAPDGPESLLDTVLKADKERTRLLAEAETAHDPHRIAEIQTRLADMSAHAAPARAAAILAGLGFDDQAQQRPCSDFSGGWRMRVALAATLFAEPDLLLLDEPTNYLDLEGTLWLEEHLARYPHTLIVISHERDLLDHSVDVHLVARRRQARALLARRLFGLRAPAPRTPAARCQAGEEAGAQAQASASLRRPLPRQGLEGAPGAIAAEAARQARRPVSALVSDQVREIEIPSRPPSASRRRSSRVSTRSRSATSPATRSCAA